MKKISVVVLTMCYVLSGWQAWASDKSLSRHYHQHPVSVRLSSSASGVLKEVSLKHESLSEKTYLLSIKGAVIDPWNRDRQRAVITARFSDKDGKIVAEEKTEVPIGAAASSDNPRSFSIKIDDKPEIVQCNLDVELM